MCSLIVLERISLYSSVLMCQASMHIVLLPLFLGLVALCTCVWAVDGVHVAPTRSRPVGTRLKARLDQNASNEQTGIGQAKKVAPNPLITARPDDLNETDSTSIVAGMPAGTLIDGEYIIIYKPGVTDVRAAVAESQAQALRAVREAAPEASITDVDPNAFRVSVISVHEAPAGVPSQAVIVVPGHVGAAAVRTALHNSENVEGIIQNRVVATTQTGRACYPATFASGVQGTPAAGVSFNWNGCLNDTTAKLALFGERCGSKMNKFRWTGIYAYNPATNEVIQSSSGVCVRFRSAESDEQRQQQLFGKCGVAPEYFVDVPTKVCMEDESSPCANASALSQHTVSLSRSLCSGGFASATYQGSACGPNKALIQWNRLVPKGCVNVARDSADLKSRADWLGQCGVPPLNIAGLPTRVCKRVPDASTDKRAPSSPPSSDSPPSEKTPPVWTRGKLPTVPVKSGETLNWGVGRVGSYNPSGKTTVDVTSAAASTGFKVVVIDTGSEAKHPDLNVVEFVDFVDASGSTWHGKDGNGHGTHVAGIIGAKNNGAGIIGVVPNMPIVAMKVLPKEGSGPLDKVYKAYAEVLSRLKKGEKIASINLSLSSITTDAEAKRIECDWISKMQAYGTAVCAAAGNDGEDLVANLPAACDEALTVSSLDSADQPSYFSNWAPMTNEGKQKSLIAGPGSGIYSTYKDKGYATLSGTSMATPYVAGVAAHCFLTGNCKFSTQPGASSSYDTNYPTLLAAAAAYPCNSNRCGPSWGAASGYYGYCVNARQF